MRSAYYKTKKKVKPDYRNYCFKYLIDFQTF